MQSVTPHIARGRRLALGLFITAGVISVALVVALVPYVLRELGS
ncbi:hypothetical protein BX264_5638 [Streptomyces sp. 2333.5]|nr:MULTISPECIES: hypothetical protein [Streptomyces]PJJ05183.1 hypothetical protein BX264_5638 [Streptomyces sp. 2333.5]SEE70060.1 hypothetical protein SAMN05428943_5740 [Streptomyces sp. 2314.4]SEE95477.1 hypothetical protein SAMN05428942_5736 [Streptomyces sp. 2112.2]SOE10423.1 hypothetical protein SAMN06272775_1467 [Streptomyces sp. 2323.1]